ncbi:hypothetical protein ACTXG6_40365 [Pseudonocardia sp. Cha107L01]|uniref:hypothetical protein n=1 Tax=Pseudonocardia sp. Cha107L01 TaxID=3457576 RepID=UPI00403E86C9
MAEIYFTEADSGMKAWQENADGTDVQLSASDIAKLDPEERSALGASYWEVKLGELATRRTSGVSPFWAGMLPATDEG